MQELRGKNSLSFNEDPALTGKLLILNYIILY